MFGFWKPNIRASLPGTGRRLGLQERRSGRAGALPPRRASGLASVWFTVARLRKGGNREPCSWLGKPWGKPGKALETGAAAKAGAADRTRAHERGKDGVFSGRRTVARTESGSSNPPWPARPGHRDPWARRQLEFFFFINAAGPTKDKEKEGRGLLWRRCSRRVSGLTGERMVDARFLSVMRWWKKTCKKGKLKPGFFAHGHVSPHPTLRCRSHTKR